MSLNVVSPIDLECPVCYYPYRAMGKKTPMMGKHCTHNVCLECLKQLPKKECPLCAASFQLVQTSTTIIKLLNEQTREIDKTAKTVLSSSSGTITPNTATVSRGSERKKRLQAIQKAAVFIETDNNLDVSKGGVHLLLTILTGEDLDLLWIHKSDLFEIILSKIYHRLSTFEIDSGNVPERYTKENIYAKLIFLGARKRAADDGDVIAQFCMGYYGLRFRPGCQKEALIYLKQSAAIGLPLAEKELGLYYKIKHKNQRSHPEFLRGVVLLEKSASKGCVDAMCILADIYSIPNTEHYHPDKSLDYLKRSAALGFAPSLKRLGDYYQHSGDLPLAVFHYQEAVSRGYMVASRPLDRSRYLLRERQVLDDDSCILL